MEEEDLGRTGRERSTTQLSLVKELFSPTVFVQPSVSAFQTDTSHVCGVYAAPWNIAAGC